MWVRQGITNQYTRRCLALALFFFCSTGASAEDELPLTPCNSGYVFSPFRGSGGTYVLDASSFYNLGRIYDTSALPESAKRCMDKRSPSKASELYDALLSRVVDGDLLAFQTARRLWSTHELKARLAELRASKRYRTKTCEPQGFDTEAPAYYFALAQKFEPIEGPEGAAYLASRGIALGQLPRAEQIRFNEQSCEKSFSELSLDAEALSTRSEGAEPQTKPNFRALGDRGSEPPGRGVPGPPALPSERGKNGEDVKDEALKKFVNLGRALSPVGLDRD